MQVLGRAGEEARDRASALLSGWASRTRRTIIPSELSGGQQQRVAIAAAGDAGRPHFSSTNPHRRSTLNWCRKCSMLMRDLAASGMTM